MGETIREELARLLLKDVGDPRLEWVTITGVDVSPDLKNARVYYVATGVADPAPVHRSLDRATLYLQGELGRSLKMRHTPRLKFRFDDTFDNAERIDKVIEEVKRERDSLSAESDEARLARLLQEAGDILVATHRNPDGDAIGSLLGFAGILRLMGKKPVVFCPDGVPSILRFLAGADGVVAKLDEERCFELTVCLDTAAEQLLPEGFPGPERRGTLAVIDHHQTHGELGDLVIRRVASSVGEILYDLSRELVWPLDAEVAECLYTSIVSDTGSFRYSSTTESTHRVAAELIARGADTWKVATALYESYPVQRQRLLGEVLGTLRLSEDGRFACMTSTPETLRRVGAKKEDLDSIINMGRAIDTVEISAMLRLEPGGDVRASFRSKGRFDVAGLAARFGGGGHRNAAGCTLKGTDLQSACRTIREAAEKVLAGETPSEED